jgi:glycosyltransferase involved in cell wall biosynthesis
MQPPTVSIVIPTYNRVNHLARSILSCMRQSYPAIEILVVDNASTDGTGLFMQWAMKQCPAIRYHRNEMNIGAIPNFDLACRLVSTEYFSFLSDDDLLLPDFLERAMPAFKIYPSIGLSGLSCVYITGSGKYLGVDTESWKTFGILEVHDALQIMTSGMHNTWTTCVFKTSAFHEVGGINPSYDQCADLSLLVRLTSRYPIHVDRSAGGYFVRHKASSCNNREWLRLYDQINMIAENLESTTKSGATVKYQYNLKKYAKNVLRQKITRDSLSGNATFTKRDVADLSSHAGGKLFVGSMAIIAHVTSACSFVKRIDLPEAVMLAMSHLKKLPHGMRAKIENEFDAITTSANEWLQEYQSSRNADFRIGA